ncbi:hypothetical protein [Pseudoduganella dura]|nr:hypothetical protein [Pseudoduganella dura]
MITEAIETFIEGQKVSVRLKSGANAVRKARADSPSLAAGVISFPRDRINEWPRFRDHAIRELQVRYADRLRCVLEHLDERHPHVHFYLVPRPGESFGKVHDGYEASREARKASGNKIRSAFNAAMSAWQDWVHEAICGPFALARLGPGRSRMSRRAWELEQQKAALAAEQVQASRDRYDLDRRRRQLEIEQKVAKSKHADSWADIEKTRNNLGLLYASLTDQQRARVTMEIPNAIELMETGGRLTTKFRPR